MDHDAITKRIEFVRDHLGLSQPEFGELTGLSQPTISRFSTRPFTRPKTVERHCHAIAETTGFRFEWLFYGIEPALQYNRSDQIAYILNNIQNLDDTALYAVRCVVESHSRPEKI